MNPVIPEIARTIAQRARRPALGGMALMVAGLVLAAAGAAAVPAEAAETARKPNILVIMGDDVGWFNVGAYHRGIMSGKTPNIDKLAAQGMMFTDYYAGAVRPAAPISSPANCRSAPG